MKESFVKNITQVFFIVFSVVLGLYLNDKIEAYKNKQEAKKILLKIKSELQENKKLLDYWVPYHQKIVKSLDSVINNKIFIQRFIADNKEIRNIFTRGTIKSDMPASDAWEIAKSHPLIVNFQYDELLLLSKIYKQQKGTYTSLSSMIELLLSPNSNTKENAVSNLQYLKNQLENFTSKELQLVRYYEEGEVLLKYESL